jgi:hypothetical protein
MIAALNKVTRAETLTRARVSKVDKANQEHEVVIRETRDNRPGQVVAISRVNKDNNRVNKDNRASKASKVNRAVCLNAIARDSRVVCPIATVKRDRMKRFHLTVTLHHIMKKIWILTSQRVALQTVTRILTAVTVIAKCIR